MKSVRELVGLLHGSVPSRKLFCSMLLRTSSQASCFGEKCIYIGQIQLIEVSKAL